MRKMADKTIVLSKGNIVGLETRDELMKNNNYDIEWQTTNYSFILRAVLLMPLETNIGIKL